VAEGRARYNAWQTRQSGLAQFPYEILLVRSTQSPIVEHTTQARTFLARRRSATATGIPHPLPDSHSQLAVSTVGCYFPVDFAPPDRYLSSLKKSDVWKFDFSGNVEWLGMLRTVGLRSCSQMEELGLLVPQLVACISPKTTSRYFISVNSGSQPELNALSPGSAVGLL
jgi:hypothetical protein